jgi:hydroxymethylpyrimidine pyrophosphatase-like HAD family hydrolase
LIKLAGFYDEIIELKDNLDKMDLCESAVIKDPFYENYSMMLLTKKGVSKGSCIDKIKTLHGGGVVIAAGNDHNDLSMFKSADISIAMEGSPEDVLQKADIVAPSCDNHGIIEGLEVAIALAFKSYKREKSIWN